MDTGMGPKSWGSHSSGETMNMEMSKQANEIIPGGYMCFGENQRGRWDSCVHGGGEGVRMVRMGFWEVVTFAVRME